MKPIEIARRCSRAPLVLAMAGTLALAACGSNQTGLGLNVVSEDQVAQMGQESWQKIKAETPASDNARYRQAAEQISNNILAATGHDPAAWEVVVFQGDQANAFALPGGRIGVYEGMFDVAENPSQLAAVIGHEIAHVDRHHATERVNTQAGTQLGTQMIATALGAAGVAPPETTAQLLGAGAQYAVTLPYSRNQELEADKDGLIYMARAGYDPRAAVQLWQNMQSASGGGTPTFLSTHPGHDERIQRLQANMPEALEIYRANS